MTMRQIVRWYRSGAINRRTFVYLWATRVHT